MGPQPQACIERKCRFYTKRSSIICCRLFIRTNVQHLPTPTPQRRKKTQTEMQNTPWHKLHTIDLEAKSIYSYEIQPIQIDN